jgi:predicted transcriptional regulator
MSSFESRAHRTAADCLHHNIESKVLICKEYGYAIASWKRHLADYHTFTRAEMKEATRCFQGLETIRPENALVPPPDSQPIEFL